MMWGCKGAEEPAANGTDTTKTTPAGDNAGTGNKRPAMSAKGNSVTGDTVKIGLVASLNGDLLPWGQDSKKGAELAVEEANAAGGIDGKKIELMVEDSASKPEQGKSAAEKLISQGAIAVVGEVASGITAQIAQSAFEKGVPVVAVGATRTDLTDVGNNVFRVCYTDAFQGPVMAKFAYEELGLRNIALMTDKQQPYSTGLSNSFRDFFEKLGGKIIQEEFYESKNSQFSGQLTNLKSKNPDGIFMSGYFTEVGQIAKQAREQGINAKFLGGDGWDSLELLSNGGDAILGGYFCNHYNNQEDRAEVKDFLDKWKKKYEGKLPGTTMGALGYDATLLTIDAMKRAKTKDSVGLRDALDETEGFKGVSGVISLKGKNGNPTKRALVVEVQKPDGQLFRKAYEYDQVVGK